jgi:hypothetical protein
VGVAFSAAMEAGAAAQLAAAIGSSTALAGSDSHLAAVLGESYARAVVNLLAR